MSDNNNIDGLVNDAFGSMDKKAPEGLWSALDKSLAGAENSKTVDEAVKASFEANTKKAPAGVWNGVNRQLNIDSVWNGVLGYLNQRTRWRLIWLRWGIPLGILLLFVGAYGIIQMGMSENETVHNRSFAYAEALEEKQPVSNLIQQDETKKLNSSTEKSRTSQLNAPTQIYVPDNKEHNKQNKGGAESAMAQNSQLKTNGLNNSGAVSMNSGIKITVNTSAKSGRINEKPLLDTLGIDNSEVLELSTTKNGFENKHLALIDISAKPLPISFHRLNPYEPFSLLQMEDTTNWELGGFVNLLYGYLLNNDVRNGFDANGFVELKTKVSWQFGFSALKPISQNQNLQLDLIWTHFDQEIGDYQEGYFFNKTLRLNYISSDIGILHRTQAKGLNFKRTVIGGGVKLGYLINSTQRISDNRVNRAPLALRKFDLSVDFLIGRSFEKGNLTIEYGIRSDVGLINVFNGNDHLPSKFNVSRTIGLGPYVAIRQRVKK